MKKTNEYITLLWKELEEYEKETPMTDEERSALRDWVKAGNSVHNNGSMFSGEGGYPVDFLDVYREEEYIRKRLDSLEGKEKEKYLRELMGEVNIEDLRERIDRYWFMIGVYEYVLRKHGLMAEAEAEIKGAERRSAEFVRLCEESNDGIEMPFDEGRDPA